MRSFYDRYRYIHPRVFISIVTSEKSETKVLFNVGNEYIYIQWRDERTVEFYYRGYIHPITGAKLLYTLQPCYVTFVLCYKIRHFFIVTSCSYAKKRTNKTIAKKKKKIIYVHIKQVQLSFYSPNFLIFAFLGLYFIL